MAEQARSRPTMKDVASVSGVSQSTVSRILSGAPLSIPVSEATRDRVLDAARQLRYEPNPLARALRGGRTMLIGLIVLEMAGHFISEAVQTVWQEVHERGYGLVLATVQAPLSAETARNAVLEARQCDAVLILGDLTENPYLLEALNEYPKRTVTMWHSPASALGVAIDNTQGIWSLVDHLVAQGHTRLGFIGSRRSGQLRERRDAFLERTAFHGVEGLGADGFEDVPSTFAAGAHLFREQLSRKHPPSAIVASTDVIAVGALHAAYSLGLKVPDDVAITGFDDIPLAAYAVPPLTTVRQPMEQMVRAAVQLAIDGPGDDVRQHQVFSPELVVRDSA